MCKQFDGFDSHLKTISGEFKDMQYSFERVIDELAYFNDLDPRKKMDHLQRKIVKNAFVELLNPIERSINVQLKDLRKILEEF